MPEYRVISPEESVESYTQALQRLRRQMALHYLRILLDLCFLTGIIYVAVVDAPSHEVPLLGCFSLACALMLMRVER